MSVVMDSEADGHELPVDTETPETILMSRSTSELVQRAIYNLPVHYRVTGSALCEPTFAHAAQLSRGRRERCLSIRTLLERKTKRLHIQEECSRFVRNVAVRLQNA